MNYENQITRPEPPLWIERIVLFATDNPWTKIRDIPLTRGINIIQGICFDSSKDVEQGHSVGKTTLIRLIRFALGDERFGVKEEEQMIYSIFPRGYIALQLFLFGKRYAVLKSFGVNGQSASAVGLTIEQLIHTELSLHPYSIFMNHIQNEFVKQWVFPHPPDSTWEYSWSHMLGWMMRDQETRHRQFHVWKEKNSGSSMPFFQRVNSGPLHFVKMILKLVNNDEYKCKKELAELEEKIKCAKEFYENVKRQNEVQRALLEQMIGSILASCKVNLNSPFWKEEGSNSFRNDIDALSSVWENTSEGLVRSRMEIRSLEEMVEEFCKTLKKNDSERKMPNHPSGGMCAWGNVLFTECDYIKKLKVKCQLEISESKRLGHILDDEKLKEIIFANLDCKSRLKELQKKEVAYLEKQNEINGRLGELQGRQNNLKMLIDKLDSIECEAGEGDKPSPNELLHLEKEKEKKMAHLFFVQNQALHRLNEFDKLYDNLCKQILGSSSKGIVEYPPHGNELGFSVEPHEGKKSGAAVSTQAIHVADILALMWSALGHGVHPGLLIHDSPREADMTGYRYETYLRGVHKLVESLGGNENAPFQYIISTTTPPPAEMDSLVCLKLAAYPETELLFTKSLYEYHYGREGELGLAGRQKNT